MNTITRDTIIEATIHNSYIAEIIVAYCNEYDKEEDKINTLITYLLTNPMLLLECYGIALEYFQHKYEIVLLHDKFNNLITIY